MIHRLSILTLLAVLLSFACGSSTAADESYSPDRVHLAVSENEPAWGWPNPACPGFDPSMPAYALPLDAVELINGEPLLELLSLSILPDGLLDRGFHVRSAPWLGDDPVRAFSSFHDDRVPVYVSSGVVLHLLHIFFDQTLVYIEQEYLLGDLTILADHLYTLALDRGDRLAAAYLAVGASLLDPDFRADPSIAETVAEELALIRNAAGFAESPIFGYAEDYSQYIPRGHYDTNERLSRYFLASMWFGRMTFVLHGGEPHGPDADFLVSEQRAMEQTLSALGIAADMGMDAPGEITLGEMWRRIYAATALFAGFSDDLSVPEYHLAISELTGLESVDPDLLDQNLYMEFVRMADSLFARPAVYSGTGEAGLIPGGESSELADRTMGFRLLGQRWAPDAQILGSLVFPFVGPDSSGEHRTMPTGLDLAAVMGSDRAVELLERQGAFQFADYDDILASLESQVSALDERHWHSTLYMAWLGLLGMSIEPLEPGYPSYMLTPEWGFAGLSRFLASWAMLRHDTILYVKQSYTAQIVSVPPSGLQPSSGFVEPLPEVYHEAVGILSMLRYALMDMEMMDIELEGRLLSAESFVTELRDISIQELEGQPLSPEQNAFLGSISVKLLSLVDENTDPEHGSETTLVADVHTDQNSGQALEVASGNLDLMVVVFPRPDGTLEVAAGPVLSYYEFTVPQSGRLTDTAWRSMLSSGVSRPWWTGDYIGEAAGTASTPVR